MSFAAWSVFKRRSGADPCFFFFFFNTGYNKAIKSARHLSPNSTLTKLYSMGIRIFFFLARIYGTGRDGMGLDGHRKKKLSRVQRKKCWTISWAWFVSNLKSGGGVTCAGEVWSLWLRPNHLSRKKLNRKLFLVKKRAVWFPRGKIWLPWNLMNVRCTNKYNIHFFFQIESLSGWQDQSTLYFFTSFLFLFFDIFVVVRWPSTQNRRPMCASSNYNRRAHRLPVILPSLLYE